MQNTFINGFKKFDAFGALYQTTIDYQQKEYKTIIGALITLILYGISFAFLLYNIILWQSGQLLPKVITTNVVYSEYEFTYSEVLFTLSCDPKRSQIWNETNYDPFVPSQIILQPILVMHVNGPPNGFIDYELMYNHETQIYNFQMKNLTFKQYQKSSEETPTISFSVILGACVNSTLPSGMFCANQEKIDQYFNQTMNYIIGTTKLKKYNSNTKKSEFIDNSIYIVIDKESAYYGQVLLSVEKTTTDDGFLFPSYTSESYISGLQQSSQQISGKLLYPYYKKELYLGLQFQISPIISEQVVQFPKINEILADTGSMVSIIFYISIFAKLINEKFQDQDVINQVISFYYPKFKNIKIQCNWLGYKSKVFYQDKLLDPEKFMIRYQKLVQIARMKLALPNQLYEISRLQFIVQSLQPRKYIKQSHQVGIQLQDFPEYPQNFENKYYNQVTPKRDSVIIEQNDEIGERIDQKINSDEFLQLKQNDLQIQKLKQLQTVENSNCQLIEQDFSLLMQNEQDKASILTMKDSTQINYKEFYQWNKIE